MMLYKKKFDTFELNKTNYIAPTHDLYAEWNLHICISCLQTKINVKTHSLFLLDCLLMRVKQYFLHIICLLVQRGQEPRWPNRQWSTWSTIRPPILSRLADSSMLVIGWSISLEIEIPMTKKSHYFLILLHIFTLLHLNSIISENNEQHSLITTRSILHSGFSPQRCWERLFKICNNQS